jgi:predicted N-acetyltransferase YhbS
MGTKFLKYKPTHFLPIRDFLVENYRAFAHPVNWDMVRWNYSRCFCAPMLGAWGTGEEAEKSPDTTGEKSRRAIRLWESSIGVWETDDGGIAGVVCPDEYVPWHPAQGQAFLQRSPEHEHLLPEMLEYAEKTFVGRGSTRIFVGEHDRTLQKVAGERGFVRDEEPCEHYMEYDLAEIPGPVLPDGYRFTTMADNNDLEKRREVFGRSFKHPDPDDWPTVHSYRELQKAPDYRRERDIVVERPDGGWVACTIVWFDPRNREGTVEPVGAIQLGMGREVVMEGLRRLRDLGADKAHMTSGLKYYEKLGFEKRFPIFRWVKRSQPPGNRLHHRTGGGRP